MKINCQCGAVIPDQTDGQSQKAHFIPDQDYLELFAAIDHAIEQSGPTPQEKEAACMQLRQLVGQLTRQAWQCRGCGRVHLEQPDRQLQHFIAGSQSASREIFRGSIRR